MTTVGSGKYTYVLERDWAQLPEGMTMGNASAVATDSRNQVYVFQRKDPPVLISGPEGTTWVRGACARLRKRTASTSRKTSCT